MKRIDTIFKITAVVLMAVMCLLSAAFAASGEKTSPVDVIEETTTSAEYEYDISIIPPSGWYADSADITIIIRDMNETGWKSAELICPGTGGTVKISGANAKVTVSENGNYTVRVTDPTGKIHEAVQAIECFDTTAPAVTAGIRDKVLHCEASDGQSGVHGIMVDGNLYTTLHDGALDLRLEDYSGAGKTLSVTAIDKTGNRSAITTIDNPYYSDATPTPAASNAPVIIYTGTQESGSAASSSSISTRSSSGSTSASSTTPISAPAATTSTTSTTSVTPTPAPTSTPTPAPTPEPVEITLEPGSGYSENGNAVTRDLLYDKHTNKQFITVQTRNGNTMYLVIDYDKVSDEDEEQYQTYFLNPVDEADLLALLDDDVITALTGSAETPEETPAVCTCKEKCVIGSINTACPVCSTNLSECTGVEIITPTPELTPEPEEVEESKSSTGSGAGGVLVVLVILGMIGGGAFYFLKNKKSKPQTAGGTDFDDYDFGEEDDELDIPEEVEKNERASDHP